MSAPERVLLVDCGLPLLSDGSDLAVAGRNQVDHCSAALMLDRNMRLLAQAHTLVQRTVGQGYARLIDTNGLEDLGYARAADYCIERLGMSLRSVQELAQMERMLPQYPALDAAWQAGRVSRSKVMLLLRHVSPSEAPDWAARAEACTVRRLKLMLQEERPIENGQEPDEKPAGQRFQCRVDGDVWFKWQWVREMVTAMTGRETTDAECLQWCAVELLNGPELVPDAETKRQIQRDIEWRAWLNEERAHKAAVREVTRAALEEQTHAWHFLEAGPVQVDVLADLSIRDDADPETVDRCLRNAVRLSQHVDFTLMTLLWTFNNYHLAERAQFTGLEHYAQERLGLSGSTVRGMVRLRGRLFNFPHVKNAYRSGHLTRTQADLLCRIVTSFTEAAWTEYAQVVSTQRLKEDVRRLEAVKAADTDQPWNLLPPVPEVVLNALDAEPERYMHSSEPPLVPVAFDVSQLGWQMSAPSPVVAGLNDRDRAQSSSPDGSPALSTERQMSAPSDELLLLPTGALVPGIEWTLPDLADLVALAKDPVRLWQTCAPRVLAEVVQARRELPPCTIGCLSSEPSPAPEATYTVSIWIPAELEDEIGRALDAARAALGVDATMTACFGLLLDAFIATHGRQALAEMKSHPIETRDSYCCTVPTCSARGNLHDHHVVFRSHGGGDELPNRTTACEAHHLRGIHTGRIIVRGEAPDGLVWILGVQVGKPPHQVYVGGLKWTSG